MPSIIRWLGLARQSAEERRREREAELTARADALRLAQSRLDQLAAEGQIAPEILARLRARHADRTGRLPGDRADAFEALGRHYRAVAARPGLSAARRSELRAEAHSWFQKSLAVWRDWTERKLAAPYATWRLSRISAQ